MACSKSVWSFPVSAAIVLLFLACTVRAAEVAPSVERAPADLVALQKRLSEFSDDLPELSGLGVDRIVAFEEHPHFAYVMGEKGPSLKRRIVLLKPDVLVVDDCRGGGVSTSAVYVVKGEGNVTQIEGSTRIAPLKQTVGNRHYSLTLPPDPAIPGTIAVKQDDGKQLLAERLLPSGVMPHGSKGVKLLESWDSTYRRSRLPGWDVGRPAGELKKAVEGGTLKPGRALVLGCGTGSSAIYLAEKGFDVTGADVAPTALTLAEQKARKAGVKVRWLVADVVAMPDLGAFDLIFDRGCYHHVRRYNAAGFVKTVCSLTREGSLFLLLAGNANEARHYGPPRVKETELCGDFAADFAFQWLREMRFEGRDPSRKGGPMAWSALLRRRAVAENRPR